MGKLNRRTLLRGAGGAVVGLPLLNMFKSTGRADTGLVAEDGFPLRFVVFYHPNGVVQPDWWPPGTPTEASWELGPILQPLAPHKDHLVMLEGVDMLAASMSPGEQHQAGMGALLTGRPLQNGDMVGGNGALAGWADGISIDQLIAQRIGTTTAFRSLHFGVRANAFRGTDVRCRMSYTGPAAPVAPEDDPVRMWNRLFSELGSNPSAMARLRDRRTSVLDVVREQFAAVERSAGAEDRVRLDQHAAYVSDLQSRIRSTPVVGDSCMQPAMPGAINPDSAGTMEQISELQIDMMVMALACDLTRVATIQFSNEKNHATFPWLGSTSDDHQLGHEHARIAASRTEWSMRIRWYASQFGRLLARMREIPEGAGTMLDHTIVLWVSALAHGNHSHRSMPFLTAGSLEGRVRTGRYLNYGTGALRMDGSGGRGYERGRPHNDLHVSLQNAFGIESDTFGDERFCTGPLPGFLV